MKTCITGGPRTGKTTLAQRMFDETLIATVWCDGFMHDRRVEALPERERWSAVSAIIAEEYLTRTHPQTIEGVQVPRALRKFIEAHPGVKPCDRLVILRNAPHEPWTPGQARMAKGIDTVLAEILPELRRLGVRIEERH